MSEDIKPRVGDRVWIKGTIINYDDGSLVPYRVVLGVGGNPLWCKVSDFAKVEPRQIAVGDRVECGGLPNAYLVKAIDDGLAWLKPEKEPLIWITATVDRLTPAGEAWPAPSAPFGSGYGPGRLPCPPRR